ncbi:MAG: hypothetical protein AB7N76_22285 [Planctomycetota bacterium]
MSGESLRSLAKVMPPETYTSASHLWYLAIFLGAGLVVALVIYVALHVGLPRSP